MVSPKSVHQRSFGRLGVLTMGGETLHATDGAHRPTQMDLRRMCARYIKRNAELVGFGHGTVWYLAPDFHTFTSKNCTSLSLGHSTMM